MFREFSVGEVLEVEPVEFSAVKRGDVVVFTPPAGGELVVHRVVKKGAAGWMTAGDNNCRCDAWVLTAETKLLRVVARRDRSGKVHPVAGGAAGMRRFYRHRLRRKLRVAAGKLFAVLVKLVPGKRELPAPEVFGADRCYFHRGVLIAKQHGDEPVVWVKKFYKLRFYLR